MADTDKREKEKTPQKDLRTSPSTRDRADELGAAIQAAPSFGWSSLAALAAGGLTLGLCMLILVQGFVPPALVLGLLMVAGFFLLGRPGRAGLIVMLVGFLASAGLLNAFAVIGLFNVQSPYEFVPILLMDVSIIAGLTGCIAGLRQKTAVVSPTPRVIGTVATAVVLAGIAASVIARASLEQGRLEPGDVAVSAQDFDFRPNNLEASAGKVTLYFANADRATHSFTSDELNVDYFRPGGTVGRITFLAQPGTYEFHCEPHPEMKGRLIVK